ncbi:hypothetical protein ACS229_29085, partial [Klebsiella pneumoniae]|uniref:hypothetical protein n=1 Tax=Klebsiella pneumoniae TaxID=573 RepID=UPI003F27FE2C
YQMIDGRDPELVVDLPYGGGAALTYTGSGSYADPDADFTSTTTCYAHSVGDIVTDAVDAGLRIDRLEEHTASEINPRGDNVLQQGEDGIR